MRELRIPIGLGTAYATFRDITGEYKTISVPVRTLDDYSFTNVALIKIDVEGHEFDVLKGAELTIAREKPVMIIEIEARYIDVEMDTVFKTVFDKGYEAFFLYLGKMLPFKEFRSEVHQKPFITKLPPKNYVHNFIFKPLA